MTHFTGLLGVVPLDTRYSAFGRGPSPASSRTYLVAAVRAGLIAAVLLGVLALIVLF